MQDTNTILINLLSIIDVYGGKSSGDKPTNEFSISGILFFVEDKRESWTSKICGITNFKNLACIREPGKQVLDFTKPQLYNFDVCGGCLSAG